MKRLMLFAGAAAMFAGCATVEISSPGTLQGIDVKGAEGKADRAIMVANEGYYLFHAWPLVAGDVTWVAADREIDGGIKFFSDQIDGDRMINALEHYAKSRNCDLVDIVINNNTECKVGLFGLLDWFNTIVGWQQVAYSGVLRPRK